MCLGVVCVLPSGVLYFFISPRSRQSDRSNARVNEYASDNFQIDFAVQSKGARIGRQTRRHLDLTPAFAPSFLGIGFFRDSVFIVVDGTLNVTHLVDCTADHWAVQYTKHSFYANNFSLDPGHRSNRRTMHANLPT